MFKPKANCVMVTLVERNDAPDIILPDSASKNGKVHDLIVHAVGKNVTEYKKGDRVQTPLPKNSQIAQFEDDGDMGTFIFWDQEDIYGKWEEA